MTTLAEARAAVDAADAALIEAMHAGLPSEELSMASREANANYQRVFNLASGIANTIANQIKWGVKASLGYHAPMFTDRVVNGETQHGLTFKAKILPFKKNGERASGARIMRISIYLNGLDYYDITVGWLRGTEWVTHFETTNVSVDQLNALLLALDYDGPTVTNAAYWFTAEEEAVR